MTRASILVPTHDHWATLPLAVGSALRQTVPDIEVVVIGDGVTARVREVAVDLAARDARVVFLDLPKGPFHGEIHRDTAILRARSDAVFYLCDDDLLLPRHVENLLGLLAEADFVQSRNGYVDRRGELVLYPTDLADPAAIGWHLAEPRRNSTSLTGTAHRRSTYLALPEGWTTTPAGEWPDHFMWKKFFRQPGFRGATHSEMTAIQLPTSTGREEVSQTERVRELEDWERRLCLPDAHGWLQGLVARSAEGQLAAEYRERHDAGLRVGELNEQLVAAYDELGDLQRRLALADAELVAARVREDALRARLGALDAALAGVEASHSWRLTAPLRGAAELKRRVRNRRGLWSVHDIEGQGSVNSAAGHGAGEAGGRGAAGRREHEDSVTGDVWVAQRGPGDPREGAAGR